MKVKFGITRFVFVTRRFAVKIPQFKYGWKNFLGGLQGNLQEVEFWRASHDSRLCPVLFSVWGGWIVIMPACKELTEQELMDKVDWKHFKPYLDGFIESDLESWDIPVEYKSDSFGWYKGRVVAIDYGS